MKHIKLLISSLSAAVILATPALASAGAIPTGASPNGTPNGQGGSPVACCPAREAPDDSNCLSPRVSGGTPTRLHCCRNAAFVCRKCRASPTGCHHCTPNGVRINGDGTPAGFCHRCHPDRDGMNGDGTPAGFCHRCHPNRDGTNGDGTPSTGKCCASSPTRCHDVEDPEDD